MKKNFVIDTNVILHDSSCIHQFKENNVIVPITVLEELDHFKKGNETINFHARKFSRTLDALSGTKIVFTGDIFQIDHPYLDSHSNGLSYLIEKMQGQKLHSHINLVKGERSELAELACDLL